LTTHFYLDAGYYTVANSSHVDPNPLKPWLPWVERDS